MIDGMLLLWYLLTAGCLVFLIYDMFTNTPLMGVMKLAWFLIVLYSGPIGLLVYLLSCRQPLPGTHDRFIAAHWKQTVGSIMHCVAGDATGIIVAAAALYYFTYPNGIDLIVEYLTAFAFGLFIFQALFMKDMMGGDYLLAVRKTFYAETVSMNMVMTGMIPVMVILTEHLPGSDDPTSPRFWAVMSIAATVGAIVGYPVNSWMVKRGLKHGMMSPNMGGDMGDMDMGGDPVPATSPDHGAGGTEGSTEGAVGASVPQTTLVAVFVFTVACLLAGVWLASNFVELNF
ncbi:MAG: DUF4396 domain-containing protein [Rhodospirillaceae bacterium]|jgi:hypothetical protein|nr:DUF4396 domain-containing protein [Rhodospirillaceae bacterium]MBT5374181.1 DUF4396 domain-containing protein [Rhodospirillaceae bacterium]MBT5751770.1 DUF4396 domain-containing protein [Rhodospirillaceae bacterium]